MDVNQTSFAMSISPLSFLNSGTSPLESYDHLVKIERAIDRAIKFPSDYTKWSHPVIEQFAVWLRSNTRHSIPVTFKSEWALMSAILQNWPKALSEYLPCSVPLHEFRWLMS